MASSDLVPTQTVSTDDAVASIVCSYDVSHTSFSGSLRSLLKRANEIATPVKVPPRRGDMFPKENKTERPYWVVCSSNLLEALGRVADTSVFTQMFKNFLEDYGSDVAAPLFSSEESSVVSDAFFKSTAIHKCPSIKGEPNVGVNVNAGPTVYYSLSNPRVSSVCLPIGEIYRAALKAYRDTTDTSETPSAETPAEPTPAALKRRLYPTLTLLDFYAVLYHSISPDHKHYSAIQTNLYDLCDAAEATSPGSGPGVSTSAKTTPDVSNPLSLLTGLLTARGGNGSEIAAAIGGISSVVKSLIDKVSAESDAARAANGGNVDPGELVGMLGNVFQSPEMKRQISETAQAASGVLCNIGASLGMTPPAPSGSVQETDGTSCITEMPPATTDGSS